MEAFNRRRARPHLVTHDEQFGTTARTRALCAALVGAGEDEIALGPNTSFGINLAARARDLKQDLTLAIVSPLHAVKTPLVLIEPPPFTTDQTGVIGTMSPSPSRPTAVNVC